nr:winged helix-turn-helix domain-containing protein [Longispora albida]
MTAAELTAQLRVSPATVSKAVGDLERQQLIRREPDGRRDRYVVDDDVWVQAWLASARMNFMLAEAVRQGASILGDDTPPGNRLRNTGRFLEAVNQEMLQAAERWRQVFEHS